MHPLIPLLKTFLAMHPLRLDRNTKGHALALLNKLQELNPQDDD